MEVDYFTKVLEDNLKAVTKPQYVDQIPRAVKGTNRSVGFQITTRSQVDKERLEEITETLGKFDLKLWQHEYQSDLELQNSSKSGTVMLTFSLEENCSVSPLPWFAFRKLMCML